jgi:hypothetical protein
VHRTGDSQRRQRRSRAHPTRQPAYATVCRTSGRHCNGQPTRCHQFIGYTRDRQQNLARLYLELDSMSPPCPWTCPSPRRCDALSNSGLKPRMPSRISAVFMRLMILVRFPTRLSRWRLGRRAFSSSRIGIATILQCRGSPRSHPRNTRMSISCGRTGSPTCHSPSAFADAAYEFERIASPKVTIRPHPSSHSAWRDARNPSARVNTDATVKPGCAA